ncbi:MAG: aminotransferase class I/II-fold pyridoxal phosphate-dependent enzyme [Xanthomonadales bacterium]|jgi:perosamine synthetase|nr:aminotransferase class I/II-fold pyridoxal phosphate-dependent enzyme [Xanthomonadales bacterium]
MAIARQRIHLPPAAWRRAPGAVLRGDLSDGPQIAEFEQAFAAAIGVPDAVAVSSGRAGLRFLFDGLNLPPGSEVICSAFAYPVIPYLVRQLGFDLKFVDCEMHTLGMDPDKLREVISERTAAVVVTHLYGVPCRADEIAEITRAHGALLIEDCAHCFGASVGGVKTGAIGDAAYFSFETSKVINTMGGGMVTMRDPALGERVRKAISAEPAKGLGWLLKRLLTTSFEATVTHPLVFNLGVYQALRWAPRGPAEEDRFASGYHGDEVSLAGKMGRYTNYQARLGLAQMKHAAARDAVRTANAERLIGQLRDRLQFQEPAGDHVTANYMLVAALVPNMHEVSYQLLRKGIDTKHHYMRDCSGMFETGDTFPNAVRAEREVLHLPAHPELSTAQIDQAAAKIAAVVDALGVSRRDRQGS